MKDKRKYASGKQTPPQIQWTKRHQQALKAAWTLELASCSVLWINNWYLCHTCHTQTRVTGRKTVLQLQYFN